MNVKDNFSDLGRAFHTISQNMKDVIIESISEVSEESAISTEEVNASVEEQSSSMEVMARYSYELAKIAVDMKEHVEKFKL